MWGTWPMPGLGAEGEMATSGNRTRIREEGGHEDSSLGSEGRPGLERVPVPGLGLKRECGGEAGSAWERRDGVLPGAQRGQCPGGEGEGDPVRHWEVSAWLPASPGVRSPSKAAGSSETR